MKENNEWISYGDHTQLNVFKVKVWWDNNECTATVTIDIMGGMQLRGHCDIDIDETKTLKHNLRVGLRKHGIIVKGLFRLDGTKE